MQTKEELEHWYKNPDPWAYESTFDDAHRKEQILSFLPRRYNRALDIGCGEGFITRDLPADHIYGIEISDLAASRLPWTVKRVHEPEDVYDLVITTGTLYVQYDHQQIVQWIKKSACKHILIAGIADWLIEYDFGKIIEHRKFNYRQYVQSVTLYEVGT